MGRFGDDRAMSTRTHPSEGVGHPQKQEEDAAWKAALRMAAAEKRCKSRSLALRRS